MSVPSGAMNVTARSDNSGAGGSAVRSLDFVLHFVLHFVPMGGTAAPRSVDAGAGVPPVQNRECFTLRLNHKDVDDSYAMGQVTRS